MINSNFEYISYLQHRVKSLKKRVRDFESGDKYTKMKSEFETLISDKDRKIRKLEDDLTAACNGIVTMRRNWEDVYDDLEKEYEKKLREKDRKIKELEERSLKAQRHSDELKDKLTQKNRELYEVKTQLEEEQGKNQKLTAQINRDYKNSSTPSSMQPNRKKISNGREKTGRKPGGQPGHTGHKRKSHKPTNRIHIPAPEKYANSPEYKPTGKIISKQLINIHISVSVDEYYTAQFRNIKTGQRVHATFPHGMQNEVNYAGNIKSLLFLLNNYCNVSIDKACEFLCELTQGTLNISKGLVNALGKDFAKKTQARQDEIFSDLILSPVLNTDCTNANVNGKQAYVYVCATPDDVMYFARDKKGHKGVKNTPVEDYQGILVHDHDKTFYKYGSNHQECLAHALRYLKDSMQNEPELKWNKQMLGLIQEMIHHRNSLGEQGPPDSKIVDEFENRYRDILAVAKEEYEYEPPSQYYRDGYNLYRRLDKYMDNHLLFLHNTLVPAENNLSERLLRVYKRKQKQVMSFRSFENLDYLCSNMSIMASSKAKKENLYTSFAKIFD